MKILPAFVALLVVLFQQEDYRHKWAGFREGSSTTMRVTEQAGSREATRVQRISVEKIGEGKVTLKYEEQGAEPRSTEVDTRTDLKKIGTETLDVDGKSFACTIFETTEDEGRGGKRLVKLWICRDAPGRVVRQEQTTATPKGEVKGAGQLTKLGQRKEFGRATVTYAVFEFKASGPEGYKASILRWISEQVPGFTVREEQHESMDASEMARISELVEFESK